MTWNDPERDFANLVKTFTTAFNKWCSISAGPRQRENPEDATEPVRKINQRIELLEKMSEILEKLKQAADNAIPTRRYIMRRYNKAEIKERLKKIEEYFNGEHPHETTGDNPKVRLADLEKEKRLLHIEYNLAYIQEIFTSYFPPGN